MAGRIDFFCDEGEERELLGYVAKSGEVVRLELALHDPSAPVVINVSPVKPWLSPEDCYLWLRSAGPLRWHVRRPTATGSDHGELVASVLALEQWDRTQPHTGQALLNVDTSPVLRYYRPAVREGVREPCVLCCDASHPRHVSPLFDQWMRRLSGWIRRNAGRVHDWREPSAVLRNDYRLAYSV